MSQHLQEKTEEVIFISKDVCRVTNGEETTTKPGQFIFLRLGRNRDKEVRKCLLDVTFPDLSTVQVTGVKLCLYQYYVDEKASWNDIFSLYAFNKKWNDIEDVSLNSSSIIAEDFNIDSTTEGQVCIDVKKSKFGVLRASTGVILEGKNSGNMKERYFMSSEWTSKAKNVSEGRKSKQYHPHWIITTKEINDKMEPTAFPSQMSNKDPLVNVPTVDKKPASIDDNATAPTETTASSRFIIIVTSVVFCGLLLIIFIFIHRRKSERKHEQMLRTFVTQEDIDRRDKFSFNSINSSNKASSGQSGQSFKWIENVKLNNACGDRTICDNIDQRIDNAAIPKIEKHNVSARRINVPTPKQRNPGLPFDYLGKNSVRAQPKQQQRYVRESPDKYAGDPQKPKQLQMRTFDAQQESIERMKQRIIARRNLMNSTKQLNRNVGETATGDSYPSLISSHASSDEEGQEQVEEQEEEISTNSSANSSSKREKNCLHEILKECETTKKDVKKIWEEGLGESTVDYTYPTNEHTEGESTYTSTISDSYTR